MLPSNPSLLLRPRPLIAAAGGGAYVGPGDLKTFSFWWGLRAYSAAYATGLGNCLGLVDQAGANPITIKVKANGDLDVAAINTWVTANTVTTIKVTKIYDQVSGTLTADNGTLADMPTLVISGVSGLGASKPALQFSGSQRLIAVSSSNISQPWTISFVGSRTGNTSAYNMIFADANQMAVGWGNAANNLAMYAITAQSVSGYADNAFHAVQAVGNGASSNLYGDGTANTVSPGTNTIDKTQLIIGADSFGQFLTGFGCEVGVFTGAFTTTGGGDASTINSNQHTYWGF